MEQLSPALRRDAELIAKVCMTVGKNDVVTLITDDAHAALAHALAQVAVEQGAFPVVMNNEFQVRRGLSDMSFPMIPPRNLHQAMVCSDEIIIVTNLEWANRFAHVSAVKESCANNAKIASVEEGMGSWELTEADIHEATERALAAMRILEKARRVRVTSPGGTDVEVCIENRPPLEVTPIKRRGQMMGPIPLWAEVAFAAVEDQTQGRIVVDGVMLGVGLSGRVHQPIVWTVDKGRVTSIQGGADAERLRQVVTGVENADVIAEFAFGVSYKSPSGSPSEKGRLGTVHFAIGDNHNAYPGGQSICKYHLDGVCLDVSIQVKETGRYILKDGKWAL